MTTIGARVLEILRNLKSDAVPKPPRPSKQDSQNDVTDTTQDDDSQDQEEEIVITLDDFEEEDVKKPKTKSFSTGKKQKPKSSKETKYNGGSNNVHTQATGSVINVIGSRDVRFGNEFIYYLGTTTQSDNTKKQTMGNENLNIKKCNLITILMESKIQPSHEYIDYISKNLGKNWNSFFRSLGYSKGRIETFEIDESRNGVSEARYKLLLDWIRNDKDGTLGFLATKLWEEGERQMVKELAIIHKNLK